MTPDEARKALTEASLRRRGRPANYSPEERAARSKARTSANNLARGALARMHPAEYRALYAEALKQVHAEMGIES